MSARGFEHWADAYARILSEVEAEHPDWDDRTVYAEYHRRCAQWKLDRGVPLSTSDLAVLAVPTPQGSREGDR